jgi:hypothetical protein
MAAKRKRAVNGKHAAKRKQAGNRGAQRKEHQPTKAVKLPTWSKGDRPVFHEHPAIDQLFAIVTALTGEISVAFDRVDTLEAALVRARALAPDALESFIVTGPAADLRAHKREALLRRVFAVLEAYADRRSSTAR